MCLKKKIWLTEVSYQDLAWPIRFIFRIARRNLSKIGHGYAIWSEFFFARVFFYMLGVMIGLERFEPELSPS